MRAREKMHSTLMIFIFLISVIDPVMADEDMTSGLICPCECAMIISTCDCTTAIQVKKEITLMKENGFSGNRYFLFFRQSTAMKYWHILRRTFHQNYGSSEQH